MTVLVLLLSSPSLMTGQAAPEADAAVSARVCAVEGTAGVSSTSERVLAAMTTLLPSRSPAPDAGAALIAALGSIGGRSKGALSPAALVDAEKTRVRATEGERERVALGIAGGDL